MAEYIVEVLADDSKDKKRLVKAEWSAERKATKWKKKRVEPAAVKHDTRFVFDPATGNTAWSGMQTGYWVPRRPGMIYCSSHCNAKDCRFWSLCC